MSIINIKTKCNSPKLKASILIVLSILLSGCVSFKEPSRGKNHQVGIASWYGRDFHGKPTASGEIYDMHRMTAAHKNVPLGTYAQVENLSNGRKVSVKINDRGPFVEGRIIDLSYAAAKKIDMIGSGTAKVKVVFIGDFDPALINQKLKYYIQAGSFSDVNLAKNMRKELERLRYSSFVKQAVVSGKTYYRVCVGPLKDDKEIMETKESLSLRGYGPIVTTNTCLQ